jgi:DNA-binding GntR family transcriptional regulator
MFDPVAYAPAYLRVSEAIRSRILSRELREGEVLPTETELARQFAVNRSTVREALRKLESGGLLGRRRGGKRLMVTRPTRETFGGGFSQALTLHRKQLLQARQNVATAHAKVIRQVTGRCDTKSRCRKQKEFTIRARLRKR